MLCAVIRGPSLEEAEQQLALAHTKCALVELRLDLIQGWNLDWLKRVRFHLPKILTLRSQDQGGSFHESEEKRLHKIRQLAALEPDFLDVESTVSPEFVQELKRAKTQIILSFHDFAQMPPLQSVLEGMRRCPADIYKIAVMLQSSVEALELLTFMKANSSVLAMGMGPFGSLTRILSPLFGGRFTYASLSDNLSSAPGQIKADELEFIYHHSELTEATALYGLIGDPIVKSLSHLSHNRAMQQLKLSSVYVKFPVPSQQLPDFLNMAKKASIRGLSVTMPLKEQVMAYLDDVDPWAQRVGAVNTLLFEEGAIKGFNTDGKGALDAIEAKMLVKGKKVILIGAGGACKALVAEAQDRGAVVSIFNRNAERATDLAKLFDCEGGGLDQLEGAFQTGYDVIVNTTPSAMPIAPQWIYPGALAMDIALQPRMTEFLHHAQLKGCPLVFGYEMFINQALGQFKIWYGRAVNLDQVKTILQEVVEKNIT
ncbi:MAG: shikimate dehydrogenase [Parachlamydia sp.]|nr:shikimate dehydrogenase [Parachlamydia sp.]